MDVREAYETARAQLRRTCRRELGEMRELDFRRFAIAVGDPLPPPADGAAVFAPPLYLSAVLGWHEGPDEKRLRPDGADSEVLPAVDLGSLRLMGVGQSLELYEPVLNGARVVEEISIDDVQLKEGESGSFILISLKRLFSSGGRPLVRCIETFVGR